jgi:acyl-CoA thioester hydrolase
LDWRKTMTYRGVVFPGQCDAMGHMNVQHYIAAFDQAMWHLVAELGYKVSWVADRQQGWADVRYLVNYRRELRAGELFQVSSGVRKIGRTSLTTFHELAHSESGEIAADVEMTSVYFDLRSRVAMEIPVQIRSAVAARGDLSLAPSSGQSD